MPTEVKDLQNALRGADSHISSLEGIVKNMHDINKEYGKMNLMLISRLKLYRAVIFGLAAAVIVRMVIDAIIYFNHV